VKSSSDPSCLTALAAYGKTHIMPFSKDQIISLVKDKLTTSELSNLLEQQKFRIISINLGELIIVEGRPYSNIRIQIRRDGESPEMFYLKLSEFMNDVPDGPAQ